MKQIVVQTRRVRVFFWIASASLITEEAEILAAKIPSANGPADGDEHK